MIQVYYSSRTGNSKKLADALMQELPDDTPQNATSYFTHVFPDDILIIVFWVEEGICDARTRRLLKKCKDQHVVLFGTASQGNAPSYQAKVQGAIAKLLPTCTIDGFYLCQGALQLSAKDRYQKMLKKNPHSVEHKRYLAIYEAARNHPNEEDLMQAKDYLRNTLTMREESLTEEELIAVE